MAEDAHIQFVDGLRVNADHLNNLQDRLHDAVVDLRRTVGLGRIAWGLRAAVTDGKVGVDPGLAFSLSGVRLALESAAALPVPASGGPFRIVMRASRSEEHTSELQSRLHL